MKLGTQTKGYILVACASALFGTMGVFGQVLFNSGITSKDIVFWKLLFAFSGICVYVYCKDKSLFRVDKIGLIKLAFIGLVCHTLENLFYLAAVEKTTISTATILLYTSPAFIIIMSRIFYKEKFTKYKLISLVLCIMGAVLTVTGASMKVLNINLSGTLIGLAAGFTYALVTIVTKHMLVKYKLETILVYSFGFGAVFSIIFSNPVVMIQGGYGFVTWISLFLIGFLSTFGAHFLYATGLSLGVEPSKAGIIATFEIVVAVTLSCLLFSEVITLWKFIGIILVIFSIVVLQKGSINTASKEVLTLDE